MPRSRHRSAQAAISASAVPVPRAFSATKRSFITPRREALSVVQVQKIVAKPVIARPSTSRPLPKEEIFGPVLTVYVYPDKKLLFQYTTSSTSLQKKLGVAGDQLRALAIRVGDQRSRHGQQVLVRRIDFVEVAVGPHEREELGEVRLGDRRNHAADATRIGSSR